MSPEFKQVTITICFTDTCVSKLLDSMYKHIMYQALLRIDEITWSHNILTTLNCLWERYLGTKQISLIDTKYKMYFLCRYGKYVEIDVDDVNKLWCM